MHCGLFLMIRPPGLDGFNSYFYNVAWEVVGDDIIQEVNQFFDNGKMLKSWNITTITLIPEVHSPLYPGDFRAIS